MNTQHDRPATIGCAIMPSLAGQKLDKYDMLEEVGHGGMAVVYRGRDTVLDREVAIKVLHAHLADREESRRRLQREAKTVAKLRHDNIVEIFDSSDPESADESYIVCEFIHGVTLRDWLDTRWKARPVLAALIAHRLCLPLEHAHSLGIVHRDIKPENVMIREDGCLKLMDFGIAQILDTQRLTTTGQLLGSPAYMAPELISGKPVDKRIDIFALGVMFYQLATNELPFAGRNPAQVLNRILEGDFRPPSQIDPKVDEELGAIISKALALKPSDRYQTARALASDLEGYLATYDIQPRPEELSNYFADPEGYVAELDVRVCRVLTRKAAQAMRDGQGARALRLLGRVLEIDPNDSRARAMLDKVRIRGQRMRQLALLGGSLALIGTVAAGVLLLQPDPPQPDRVVSNDPDRPGTTTHPASNYYVPDRLPQAIRPPPQAETETGEDVESEAGDGTEEPTVGVERTGPERPRDDTVTCTVEVEGLPAAVLEGGTYRIKIAGQPPRDLPKSGEVELEIDGDTDVRLQGDAYEGFVRVDPRTCASQRPVLHAYTKSADLVFKSAIPLSQILVTCESGCSEKDKSAARFPDLPFPKGDTELVIELSFASKGFRQSKPKLYRLHPGRNDVSIPLLERIDPGG